jgi:IS30 family transposase
MIKELLDKQYSCSLISKIIERGKNTVVIEVRRNGGRCGYDPDKAQERWETSKREGLEKMKQTIKEHGRQITVSQKLETRIEALEMQIKILTTVIKEFKK